MSKQPDSFEVRSKGDRFGELSVALKLLKREQVQSGLSKQAQLKDAGEEKRIGEVLVEERSLNLRSVQKVLLEQQRQRKGTGKDSSRVPRKKLGDFELIEKLGEGGMGTVYRARDLSMDRVVALKVLSRNLAGDRRFVERFNREVKLTGALNHPNIVTAYGAGEADGLPYLAMEFVDGESLHKRLQRKRQIPEKEALTLIKGMAAGLDHAHSNSFIHRDVKPDNALIGHDGVVKVADLGLAKSVDDDQRLTKTGTAIGTPHYISPEQARGEKDVDHRSDIYSLGATLYTLLTGRRPFDGKNNAEIMLKHLNEELENPQDLVPDLSDGAVAIISKMMAKERDDRYESCRKLIVDIDRVLGAKATVEIAGPRGESSIRAPRRRRRRAAVRAAKASSGSGCLVVLGVAGVWLTSGCWLLRHWFLS